jgi:hypothetical protein
MKQDSSGIQAKLGGGGLGILGCYWHVDLCSSAQQKYGQSVAQVVKHRPIVQARQKKISTILPPAFTVDASVLPFLRVA